MFNKIPKIVHYCWFGKTEMLPQIKSIIEQWSKVLYDYKIMLWDENNFNINSVPFVKEAYNNKSYHYVSDYVRLYALYNYGGIYLDTDVLLYKKFDNLLNNDFVLSMLNDKYKNSLATHCMLFSKNHPLLEQALDYYKDITFNKHNLYTNNSLLYYLFFKDKQINIINNIDDLQYNTTGISILSSDFFPTKYRTNKSYLYHLQTNLCKKI